MATVREDQIEAALRFLGNEKVSQRPPEEKRQFLLKKGLTEAEIAEAVSRYENNGVSPLPGQTGPRPVVIPSYPSPQQPPAQPYYPPPAYPPAGYPQPGGPYGPPSPYGYPQHLPPQPDMAQSGSSWPAWLSALGGVGAGLGLTLMASSFGQRSQEKMVQEPWDHPHHVPQQQLQIKPPQPPTEKHDLDAKPEGADAKHLEEENPKEVYEDLLSLLRQHAEESKETSALFRKSLAQQQEQYQSFFEEAKKALNVQSTQQKAQKSQETTLSAATLQNLASLIEGARSGLPLTEAGTAGSSDPIAGVGPANPLRESLDAITVNLKRLVNESASKADASKLFNTLSLILQNLLTKPTSDQHRKVNTSSNRFADLKKGASAELLKLAGFEYQGMMFVMPADKTLEEAERVRDMISSKQRTLDDDWEARTPAVETGAAPDEPAYPSGLARPTTPPPSVPSYSAGAELSASVQPGTPPAQATAPGVSVAATHPGYGGSSGMPPPAQTLSPQAVASGNVAHLPVVSADVGSDGMRPSGKGAGTRVARPWEKPAAQMPARPWETQQAVSAAAAPSNTVVQTAVGEGELPQTVTATSQPAVPQIYRMDTGESGRSIQGMAHPAESPEGQSIAHPAESEDVAQPHPVPLQQHHQQGMAHPAESEDVAQAPPVPAQQQQQHHHHALTQPTEVPAQHNSFQAVNQQAVAHPAEGSAVSEEPQSGG